MSALPCLPLMSSLKTIILNKRILVCVFLVSPCCVHRDRRPDLTVSVIPSPRFVLFVFSSVLFCSRVLSLAALMPTVRGSLHRGSRISHPANWSWEFTPPFAALPSRGSREFSPLFAAQPSRRSREFTPTFAGQRSRRSREFTPPFADQPAHRSQEMTPPPSTANPSPPARRWINARRPASDSCPPACLWLMPAGLPLTQACRIAADSCPLPAVGGESQLATSSVHTAVRGSPTPPFAGDHAAVRGESQSTIGGCL